MQVAALWVYGVRILPWRYKALPAMTGIIPWHHGNSLPLPSRWKAALLPECDITRVRGEDEVLSRTLEGSDRINEVSVRSGSIQLVECQAFVTWIVGGPPHGECQSALCRINKAVIVHHRSELRPCNGIREHSLPLYRNVLDTQGCWFPRPIRCIESF